ncbi:hypothetical protein [Marinivivus vitaminiproducens]|uniref:hypothetical protein n=1 Tax=Marinivivus vitaminiproducens TaxID=3035935 RepID=UPI0027A90249|nr:hypothetical protein P4R82_00060 [Geminicoccaceae bacterium SCSIO 64248]
MTSVHRYPVAALLPDYLRAAFGLAATLLPLLLIDTAPLVFWVLLPLAVLFAWFALRTAMQQMTVVERDSLGLTLTAPWRRRLDWSDLSRVRLAFYAPRRQKDRGWMQLTLDGSGTRLKLDSTLDGFTSIVGDAEQTALARDLDLDDTTLANLGEVGRLHERPV